MSAADSRSLDPKLAEEIWASLDYASAEEISTIVDCTSGEELVVRQADLQRRRQDTINRFLKQPRKYMCSVSVKLCVEVEVESEGCHTREGKAKLYLDALQKFVEETELDWGYLDDVVCDVYAHDTRVLSIWVGAEDPALFPNDDVYFDVKYRDLPPGARQTLGRRNSNGERTSAVPGRSEGNEKPHETRPRA